jgi:hypothetical protein
MNSAAAGGPSLPAPRTPAPTTLTMQGLTYSDNRRINPLEYDIIFSNGYITVVFVHKIKQDGRPFAGGVEIPRHIEVIRIYKGGYIWKVYRPSDYREGSLNSIYKQFYDAWMAGEEGRSNFSYTFDWTPAPTGGHRREKSRKSKKRSRKIRR